jgi:cytochrome o ubiquinol oxidase subunit 2
LKKHRFAIGFLAIAGAAIAIFFVLRSDIALITHPKGIIARSELELIARILFHLLIIIVPTFVFLFVTLGRAQSKRSEAKYDPETSHGVLGGWMLWTIPAVVVVSMAFITWHATHKLDPYRPLQSDMKPLEIQVVALDWKWLFIYPEQGIAAVNFVEFPAGRPIHFLLSADGSPMNSFWIPQLSGQIYSMTGMTTSLHLMADGPGVYTGRAAEINGEGYADMTFVAQSTSQSDFEDWIASVKQSPLQLTETVYAELVKPSIKHPTLFYSSVEDDLFDKIVMKYMHAVARLWKTSCLEN